jgi:DNA-binding NarL/FixJ family response regulator
MDKVKVVISDAQFIIRLGIQEVLKMDNQFECIGECANANELKKLISQTNPDIVTIDYAQLGFFSLEDIKFLQTHSPQTKVLVISDDENSENIFKALDYGALSFLTKECDPPEILNALIATSKSEKFICHKIIEVILDKKSIPIKEENCKRSLLSFREIEIIQLTAKGLSAKEIANQLFLSLHTVYTHKKNIMKKLKINSSSEIILYAINKRIIN